MLSHSLRFCHILWVSSVSLRPSRNLTGLSRNFSYCIGFSHILSIIFGFFRILANGLQFFRNSFCSLDCWCFWSSLCSLCWIYSDSFGFYQIVPDCLKLFQILSASFTFSQILSYSLGFFRILPYFPDPPKIRIGFSHILWILFGFFRVVFDSFEIFGVFEFFMCLVLDFLWFFRFLWVFSDSLGFFQILPDSPIFYAFLSYSSKSLRCSLNLSGFFRNFSNSFWFSYILAVIFGFFRILPDCFEFFGIF